MKHTEERQIFTYNNRNKQKLAGILHKPGHPSGTVIIMLNPGLKSRVAPHRLYLKIAERLVQQGMTVFRFDAHGIGESEGRIEGNLKEILHDQILSGVLVNDTLDTIDFLKSDLGYRKFILMGLCGGAMTALQAASYAEDIDATVMLGLPVVFVGKKNDDFVNHLNPEYAEFILLLYLKKIFSLKSWQRFFSFKSEYRLILKTMTLKFRNLFFSPDEKKTFISQHPKINRIMWERYPEVCRHSPRQLFIYAETEGNRFEFDQEVRDYFSHTAEQFHSKIDFIQIKDSNHEYSILSSQEVLLSEISRWFRIYIGN